MSLDTWLQSQGVLRKQKATTIKTLLGEQLSRNLRIGIDSNGGAFLILPKDSKNAEMAHATHRLGVALLFAGLIVEAECLLLDAVDLLAFEVGETHKSTLAAAQTLAVLRAQSGRPLDAVPLFRDCLETYRESFGNEDPDTLGAINNLAETLKKTGLCDEAETLFREALAAYRRVVGSDHPDALGTMNNLIVLLHDGGRVEEEVELMREAASAYDHVLGDDHPDTLAAKTRLADLLASTGDASEAARVRASMQRASSRPSRALRPPAAPPKGNSMLRLLDMASSSSVRTSVNR